MKLLQIFIFLIVTSVTAQVSVGASMFGNFKDFRKGEYNALRGKTTLFVVDNFDLELFTEMVKEVWTFNTYEIILRSDYVSNENAYKSEKYAPFTKEVLVRSYRGSDGLVSKYSFDRLHYGHYDINKKGKVRRRTIAGVFLFPGIRTVNTTINKKTNGYHNYGLGYLKNQLQLINRELVNDGYYWAYDSSQNRKQLKKLKKKILYVPNYLRENLNTWTGIEGEKEDPDDLFKKYDHPYEWISKETLNEKIMNATEEFFYLSWVSVSNRKFVNVINGLTGEIIYEDFELHSYNIKRNDITRLNTKIK